MNKQALLKSGKMGSAHKSVQKVFERQNSTDMFFRNADADSGSDCERGSVSSLSSLDGGNRRAQLTPQKSSADLLSRDLDSAFRAPDDGNDEIFTPNGEKKQVLMEGLSSDIEYFFSSDASAIIEHTNRVIYMEDGDIASITDAGLTLQRIPQVRKLWY